MTKTDRQFLAFDSSIAIHFANAWPTPGQEQDWADAQSALELVDTYTLSLPSAVLTEILGASPKAEHSSKHKSLTGAFTILEYDEEAAVLAAGLLADALTRTGSKSLGELAARFQMARQRIKLDLVIFATAARWNCRLAVADDDFSKWQERIGANSQLVSMQQLLSRRQQSLVFLDEARKGQR